MAFVHDGSVVFPKLTQINLPTNRVYRVDEGIHKGQVYPSITTILGAKPKPGIERWKARIGAEKAELIKKQAAVKGSHFHDALLIHLNNQEVPLLPMRAAELWVQVKPWLNKHVTCVYGQETDVFSHRLRVAGRFDVFGEIDHILAILDLKSANKPKKEEYVIDYYLQGTFYAAAVYELTGKIVKRIVFPIVSPEGLQVFECKPKDYMDQLFARIREYYDKYHDPKMLDIGTAA